MSSDKEYSETEKRAVIDFFDNDVPRFPFNIRISPISKANLTNRREMLRVAKKLASPISLEPIKTFFRNVCSKSSLEDLNDFEKSIVLGHGYFCFLHMFDIYKEQFMQNVQTHTYQYLRITGVMTDDNWQSFGECFLLSTIVGSKGNSSSNFGEVSDVVSFIKKSNEYVVLIESKDGKDMYYPLQNILSYRGVTNKEISDFLLEAQQAVEELNKLQAKKA